MFEREFLTSTGTIVQFSQILTNSTQGYTVTIETETAFDITSVTFEGTDPSGNILTSQTSAAISITLTKQFIISQNLPNINVIDFLTGLFKMFNLTAYEIDGIIHVTYVTSFSWWCTYSVEIDCFAGLLIERLLYGEIVI